MPASWAIAGIWSDVFVEPPSAMSILMALSKAFFVMIFRGVRSSLTSPTIRLPLSKAIRRFSPDTASAVAQPGRLMPIASVTQAMVFAVNIPWHDPGPGQAHISSSARSASDISPFFTFPTASNALMRLTRWPRKVPECMGPAVTTIVGISSRAAAMSMPGVILSQFVSSTRPSNAWAVATDSTRSAISSRDGSE